MHGIRGAGDSGCHAALPAPGPRPDSEDILPGWHGDDAVPGVRTGSQWAFLYVQPMVLGLCAPLCLYIGGDVA